MRRRGKAAKQGYKASPHRKASKDAPKRQPAADPNEKIAVLERRLNESLEQQTATSEVLKSISRSAFDLQSVFDTMTENVVRLCEAERGYIFRFDGKLLRLTASYNVGPEVREFIDRNPIAPGRRSIAARAAFERRTVHVADVQSDPEAGYAHAMRNIEPFRTVLAAPMLKGDDLVGAILIYKLKVKPFSDRQVALVETFASQAVIAIENTRLLNELRESLQQQTATADVLKVISRSTFDLQTVLDTLVESAARLCEADSGILRRREGDTYPLAASYRLTERQREHFAHYSTKPDRGALFGRAVLESRTIHSPDVLADPEYDRPRLQDYISLRACLAVPLVREGSVVGVITLQRTEPKPFTEKQIELVETFADQAVIAIENARLFNAEQQRTQELTESLEQQTATSDVLKVISSSPSELQTVFETILENAVQICAAKFGNLFLSEGNALRAVALHGAPQAYVEERQRNPVIRPHPTTTLGQAIATRQPVQIADIQNFEPDSSDAVPGTTGVKLVKLAGARTVLAVPMVKESEVVGAIVIYRQEVLPFTDKQIALVQNFAAQAVIAIENARLLNELRESLQQQTATADVLKVISGSAFELQTVFNTLVESAMHLCEAEAATIWRADGNVFKLSAHCGFSREFEEFCRQNPITPGGRGTITARVAFEGKIIHVPDVLADPQFAGSEYQTRGKYRSALGIPLLSKGKTIGVFVLTRSALKPYTEKQIELVKTFADQAVIAIENMRLLSELRESLQQQTATADVLKTISRSTFDLQTVLHTLVESAARLCDADKGTITRQKDGNTFYRAESYGFSREFMNYVRDIPIQIQRGSASGRALLEGKIVHIHDVKADPEYTFVEAQRLGDFRTILAVPMLREEVPVGVLTLTRAEVRPFTDRQIELVSIFADQAAIAIENVRLFESVEARTRELAKSLEELRSTQDRLVQTQKLASLGQLTAGIAHEIKNPLNFVNNFSGVSAELIDELQEALRDVSLNEKKRIEITELTETLQANLDKVVQHGKRADAIVKNMLLHSRQGSEEHRLVDINALVDNGLNLAYHGARAETQGFNIKLERSLDPTAGEADIFPQDITRVLLNLISNGFYAATQRGAESNGGDYEPTLTAITKNLGDRVEISIRDNGTGIPPDVKEKIFNPFFTTKPAGEGTGLGLSISHDIIVKQHGGSIEVYTQPGEFTEIRVILPRAAALLP